MKYIATKEFSFGFHGNRFKAGDEVPAEFITDRLISLGVIERVKEEVLESLEDVQDVLDEVIDEPIVEILTEGPESSDVTVEIVDENESIEPIEPDWEWIESLKSTRENKRLFDKYAEENFGIELDASQKIKDMIAEFKDLLADAE